MNSLSLIANACVLNQFHGHQLLFNALQLAIIMCLKFKEKTINPLSQVNLIDDDFRIALEFFCSNIEREVCAILDSFLFS
jgi:hypothetical protein